MSTAVMPQSATYDFGELLFRTAANGTNATSRVRETSVSTQHLPGSALGSIGTSIASVGTGAMILSPRQLHNALSRVSSSPAAASFVTSLLDNIQHRRLERTQSAPAPPVAPVAPVNTSRYKTELCRPFEESGTCKYGDKCQFAHGMNELRSLARHPKYKTELCRTYHTAGFCPYGPRCHFIHNREEAREHNQAVEAALMAAAAAAGTTHRPPALSPSLSDSAGSSLSHSPTSSLGSFFSTESELLSPSLAGPPPPPSPPVDGDYRLPVFNRLSANMFTFRDLIL